MDFEPGTDEIIVGYPFQSFKQLKKNAVELENGVLLRTPDGFTDTLVLRGIELDDLRRGDFDFI